MYAIVDIETTGGHPGKNRITEIAVRIHNGISVVDSFDSLVNPEIPIPLYLQAFTGITPQMVEHAPTFEQLANKLFELLNGKIFVAHNVNFDYNFIKQQFEECGINYQAKRLCTIRLSRKVFPNYKSYSLGNICAALGINIDNRHRAGGDADATVKLFDAILKNDNEQVIAQMLTKGSKEQQLPPNVSKTDFEKLPKSAGIYYFIDNRGLALYVGKAKNIKTRVSSHFSGKMVSKQKQNFMRDIYGISYLQTGTELLASLIESHEIKRLWPQENRSQKSFTQLYGLYDYIDQNGKIRLGIDKLRKDIKPIVTFANYTNALSYLNSLIETYNLCPVMCNLQHNRDSCYSVERNICEGLCLAKENIELYNQRVQQYFNDLELDSKVYMIADTGRNAKEKSVIVYEPGVFIGYCFIGLKDKIDYETLMEVVTPLKLNPVMEAILSLIIDGSNATKSMKIYTQFKMSMA